jgi:hypothetical protein
MLNQSNKLFLCVLFLCSVCSANLLAQTTLKPVPTLIENAKREGISFQKINGLFTSNANYPRQTIEKTVKNASILKLETTVLSQLQSQKPKAIELTIPYNNTFVTVELVQKSVLSDDFSVVTNRNKEAVTYQQGLYYRGIVKGDNNSLVAISFFEKEVYGMISDQRNGDLVLGRIESEGNKENYILYADENLLSKNPFECHAPDMTETQQRKMESALNNNNGQFRNVTGCVRVFLECDYKMYQNKGNSVANTVNYITAVYNNIATLYNNEQISTVTSQVYVWVTQDAYSTSSSSTALGDFKSTRGTNHNGDLAHLAALGGSGLGGVAWVDVLCEPSYGYAYSNISSSYNTVPTYSWTIEVMTHEMGHNLGSPHTQSCSWTGGALDNCYTTEGGCAAGPAPTNGGTIMSYCHLTSYGINFSNGFGTQPGNLIRSYVTAATCLPATCAPVTCAAPTAISVAPINTNDATLTWTAPSGATSYNLQYQAQGTNTWTTITGVSSPYLLSGLIGATNYTVRFQSVCASGTSEYSAGVIFKTQLSTTPCDAPTNVVASNVAQTTATINWTAVNGAANYVVQYKLSTATTWSAVTVTTNTANLTALGANKSYDLQVFCNCTSGNYSTTTAAINFSTLGCDVPLNVAVSNTTTAGTAVSWSAVFGANTYTIQYKTLAATTWTTKTSTTNSYTITGLVAATAYQVKVLTVCPTAVGSSAYSTPVDFTTATCSLADNIVFSAIAQNTATVTWSNPSNATSYKIQWRKTGATTWSSTTVTNALTYTFTGLTPNQQYDVQLQTVCTGGSSAWSATQNFTTALCPVATGITFSNVTQNTATATWTQALTITSYKIQWKLSTATAWSSANVTGMTYNFTNLVPNQSYDVQVTTNCTNGSSVWSATQNFTTSACPVASGVTFSNVAQNTATATWAQVLNITSYKIQWKLSTATTWTAANVTGTSYNFTNLIPDKTYDVQLTTNCTNGSSVWSATQNFTTSACPTATGVTFTNVTPNTATATWTQVLNITSYKIQWKLSTATAWSSANVTGTSYNFTNLTPDKVYDVQLTTNCTNGSSVWSATQNFTTLLCPVPSNMASSNVSINTATVTWTAASTYTTHKVQWRKVGTTAWVSATLTSGTTYNITGLTAATNYETQVQTVCPNLASVFTVSTTFTTLANPTCAVPTGLATTSVTASSINLTWAAATNAVTYLLQYKASTSTTWLSTANITGTTYSLTGLTAGLTYNLRLRTNCAGTNNSSAYGTQLNVTLPLTSSGNNTNNNDNALINLSSDAPTIEGEIHTVTAASLANEVINVAPNPVADVAMITFVLAKESTIKVELFNAFGQLLQTHREQFRQGTLQLNVNDLPTGIYLVRTTLNNARVVSHKLVKE